MKKLANASFRDFVGFIIMLVALLAVAWIAITRNDDTALGLLGGVMVAGGGWFYRDKITTNNRNGGDSA